MQQLSTFGVALLFLILLSCTPDAENYRPNAPFSITYYSDAERVVLAQELDLPDRPDDYNIKIPGASNSAFNNTVGQINRAKATLGRVLFYDKALSLTETVSCASCHQQELAFSDNQAFSEGIEGRRTDRNSIALGSFLSIKATYGGQTSATVLQREGLFWDERARSFGEQIRETLLNEKEMGMPMDLAVARLRERAHYPILFQKAFGSPEITEERIQDGLTEFMNAIVNVNSRFDYAVAANHNSELGKLSRLTESQNWGKTLFLRNCSSCHISTLRQPLFNENVPTVANNGLGNYAADPGKAALSGLSSDVGLFKVPALRNVTLTAPYMHDGRFATLEEVVEFYSSGIQDHPNLSEQLRKPDGSPRRFNFTPSEKAALIDFLQTLTDNVTLTDPKFSDPFLR